MTGQGTDNEPSRDFRTLFLMDHLRDSLFVLMDEVRDINRVIRAMLFQSRVLLPLVSGEIANDLVKWGNFLLDKATEIRNSLRKDNEPHDYRVEPRWVQVTAEYQRTVESDTDGHTWAKAYVTDEEILARAEEIIANIPQDTSPQTEKGT